MLEAFVHQLIAWLTPINIVLFAMLIGTAVVMFKAQDRNFFDFGNMLRDDNGKENALRLAALGAFAVSSWIVMQLTITGNMTEAYYAIYLLTWSGSAVLLKFLEVWKGGPR